MTTIIGYTDSITECECCGKVDLKGTYCLEQILIQQGFEFSHQDNSRTHYVKDLGGDGFTLLHIFLKPDGSFSGELQEFLYEDDGSQYDQITKEYVEEGETLQDFLNRI